MKISEMLKLWEGYESAIMRILDDANIQGCYFEFSELHVPKGKTEKVKDALKKSGEIKSLPKIIEEAVSVPYDEWWDGMHPVVQDKVEKWVVKRFGKPYRALTFQQKGIVYSKLHSGDRDLFAGGF